MVEVIFNRDADVYRYGVEMLVNQFFPLRESEISENKEELTLSLSFVMEGSFACIRALLYNKVIDGEKAAEEAFERVDTGRSEDELQTLSKKERKAAEKIIKTAMGRLTYRALSAYTKKELPWGILTGIRPAKLAMSVLEEDMAEGEAADRKISRLLKGEYYVSDEKIKLATDIAKKEKEILKGIDYEQGYSLYVGIPFCPTTCLYCSFTSYPIGAYAKKAEAYISCLLKEIEFAGSILKGKKLNAIYFGGGTPTTLTAGQLERLFEKIEQSFDFSYLKEYTVEAGRPDSIAMDKLMALKKHGITRISVNPQTMKQETLDIIGRRHTAEQVREAFYMAREAGFDNINMDLIAGLPNETAEDVKNTMEELLKLKPDSITIHSLAIKRAARLNMFKDKYKEMSIENNIEIMRLCDSYARKMNMEPYYMYRQKNMAGNMENVGYAAEGKAGIYNILIMEEVQTIVALGAGSITKRVYPDGRIERCENVKEVAQYIERIDEMIERKRVLLND